MIGPVGKWFFMGRLHLNEQTWRASSSFSRMLPGLEPWNLQRASGGTLRPELLPQPGCCASHARCALRASRAWRAWRPFCAPAFCIVAQLARVRSRRSVRSPGQRSAEWTPPKRRSLKGRQSDAKQSEAPNRQAGTCEP